MLIILTASEIIVLRSKQRCSVLSLLSLLQAMAVVAGSGHCAREDSGQYHSEATTWRSGVAVGSLLQVLAHTLHALQRQFLHFVLSMLAFHHAERSLLYHDVIVFVS